MKKFISILLVFIFSILSDYQIANAIEDNSTISENIQIEGTKNNKVNDDSTISKPNNDDIFGDEQTFPFVAGLGKNAAH